jgi:hypothetical protein
MKYILIFALFLAGTFYYMSEVSSDGFTNSYCNRWSQENTERMFVEGWRARDRDSEEDLFDVCIDQAGKDSVLKILMRSVYGPDPEIEEEEY